MTTAISSGALCAGNTYHVAKEPLVQCSGWECPVDDEVLQNTTPSSKYLPSKHQQQQKMQIKCRIKIQYNLQRSSIPISCQCD